MGTVCTNYYTLALSHSWCVPNCVQYTAFKQYATGTSEKQRLNYSTVAWRIQDRSQPMAAKKKICFQNCMHVEQLRAIDDAAFNSLSCTVSTTSSLSIRDINRYNTTVVYDKASVWQIAQHDHSSMHSTLHGSAKHVYLADVPSCAKAECRHVDVMIKARGSPCNIDNAASLALKHALQEVSAHAHSAHDIDVVVVLPVIIS
eukprot:19319-Heterococcus_DN1.PRE.2